MFVIHFCTGPLYTKYCTYLYDVQNIPSFEKNAVREASSLYPMTLISYSLEFTYLADRKRFENPTPCMYEGRTGVYQRHSRVKSPGNNLELPSSLSESDVAHRSVCDEEYSTEKRMTGVPSEGITILARIVHVSSYLHQKIEGVGSHSF